jgi:two-component system phosphate regulon sensor histidine kinase PhoR
MAKPLFIFYLLVAYILLQFSWWAYLLIDLNQEIVAYRMDLTELVHDDPVAIQKEEFRFAQDLKKRLYMVLGEGSVFLALLVFGIYKTKEAFRKEFALARQQKNFLLSITHEFKSPLAAVKLNLQTIQKRDLDRPKQQEIIRRALLETERINLLVENALFASRLENNNFDLHFERINFSAFIEQLIQEYIERQDHDHTFKQIITPGVFIVGDKMALSSMIYNLLENAEKYSTSDTTIEISLSRHLHEAVMTIRDEGIGIEESERLKIFEKFYRVGNEDTRRTKGTGLGLFIVQHIVHLHKGNIKVRANHPAGSIFEIRIPAEK